MMRRTAVDMENSEQLVNGGDAYSQVYYSRGKKLGFGCCLILSYGFFYALGFYAGYMEEGKCDGSGGLF